MCEQCIEVDKEVRTTPSLPRTVTDQMTLDGTAKLLAGLQAKSAKCIPPHPASDRARPRG